jgi:flagellar biosynthesis protein FlhB
VADDSFQEKTEPATPKRREDAREKGKVAKSTEVNSSLILVLGLLMLYVAGSGLVTQLSGVIRRAILEAPSVDINVVSVHNMLSQMLFAVGTIVIPVSLGIMVIGLGASFSQVGFLFTLKPLHPKWEKLNPGKGIKKILGSRHSLVELGKGLLKITIVGVVAYVSVESAINETLELVDGDVAIVMGAMGGGAVAVGLKVGLAFLFLAVLDYLFQRHEFERNLRMSKQEVKEETKMQEGDPQVKSRIRSIQRQIAYKRMMQDVPKADVIITNPTHVAIALSYNPPTMAAPKVVAKGAELIAQKIKEVGREHDIPIVEDKPLAQLLYKTVDVGEHIPQKLFQAVAQILAAIYKLRDNKPDLGTNS